MARQEVIVYTDDLDGEPIEDRSEKPTLTFGLEGTTYEIDLRPDNKDELIRTLQPYMRAARRVPNKVTNSRFQPPPRQAAKVDKAQLRDMRNWWAENWEAAGLPRASTHGRIPEKVQEAYQQHQGRRVHKTVGSPFTPAA